MQRQNEFGQQKPEYGRWKYQFNIVTQCQEVKSRNIGHQLYMLLNNMLYVMLIQSLLHLHG